MKKKLLNLSLSLAIIIPILIALNPFWESHGFWRFRTFNLVPIWIVLWLVSIVMTYKSKIKIAILIFTFLFFGYVVCKEIIGSVSKQTVKITNSKYYLEATPNTLRIIDGNFFVEKYIGSTNSNVFFTKNSITGLGPVFLYKITQISEDKNAVTISIETRNFKQIERIWKTDGKFEN